MNNRFLHIVLACALAVMVAGCFASSPQVSYYSLYAPAQQPVAAAAGTLAVSIGPVTIPDILKQMQIATGGADGRYRLADHHRWSGELDRDFARALAEQLAGNLGTERVAVFPWDQNFVPNCRVYLDVLSMGGDVGREATLNVRWALAKPGEEQPLLIRRSDLRNSTGEAGYGAWVAAQQRNIAVLGQEITTAVKETIKP